MHRKIIISALSAGVLLGMAARREEPLTRRVTGGRPAADAAIVAGT